MGASWIYHTVSLQIISRLSTSSAPDAEPWPTRALLAMAARLIGQAWNRRLAGLGISAAGASVLMALADGPLSQTQLAAQCRVTGQTMSRTLDRLERAGLVRRGSHPTDRRRYQVRRTSQGATVLRTALHGQAGAGSVFDRLPDPQRFRRDLLRLIEALEEGDVS